MPQLLLNRTGRDSIQELVPQNKDLRGRQAGFLKQRAFKNGLGITRIRVSAQITVLVRASNWKAKNKGEFLFLFAFILLQ